jgi:hypothetical protein
LRRLAEDTPIEIERIQIERLRRMSPGEKLDRARNMAMTVMGMQMAEVRGRYPEAPLQEIRLRVISRWIPRELMIRVYGWDPAEHGY